MSDDTKDTKPWKNRRMVRGRWRDPDAEKDAPARVDKPVSVKLTEAELAEFDAQIAKAGLKRNKALRIAARRIGGFLEIEPESQATLRDISRAISGIATNVNQIAKAANRTHDPAYQSFMKERQALGAELAKLDALLQPMMNVSKRRTDGLERLKEMAK